ncbi:DUF4149 domain-containing protein [Campylobacter troglodytis]|nr:DUF4149 domain-containing protein [Campylobacter troglodytis]
MKAVNLLLLGGIIGIELFLGIVVAKIIFYTPLTVEVDLFSRGLLMSGIFLAFAYVAVCVSALNLLFELVALRENFNARLKISKVFLALINLALSLLFLLYYTQPITELQESIMLGKESIEALASDEFKELHAQSERLVKVLVILQAILFFLSFKSAKKSIID